MIKVSIKESKNSYTLISEGHAEYAEYGKDILCSAVSAVLQLSAEMIKGDGLGRYKKKKGYLKIECKKEERTKWLFKYLIAFFEALKNDYPDNLRVEVIKE